MKKIKLNAGKLQLNKQKIATLRANGNPLVPNQTGPIVQTGPTITKPQYRPMDGTDNNYTIKCPKLTETIDIHTISHDDGSGCISKSDWGWCWCHGQ